VSAHPDIDDVLKGTTIKRRGNVIERGRNIKGKRRVE
jgi:hypothetical protein